MTNCRLKSPNSRIDNRQISFFIVSNSPIHVNRPLAMNAARSMLVCSLVVSARVRRACSTLVTSGFKNGGDGEPPCPWLPTRNRIDVPWVGARCPRATFNARGFTHKAFRKAKAKQLDRTASPRDEESQILCYRCRRP